MQRATINMVPAMALAGLLGSAAMGQAVPLEPVDQAVADRGPLSTSLRDSPDDLRMPFGFQRLYRVPGSKDMLMRVSGGVYAMFPVSTYTMTDSGLVPLIPPGTLFSIGVPESIARALQSTDRSRTIDGSMPGRVNDEIDSFLPEGTDAPPRFAARTAGPAAPGHRAADAGPSVVNDAAYRSQRVAELMSRAAKAAESSEQSH